MARIDFQRPLETDSVDVSVGRIAPLRGPPRDRPQSAPKPTFNCEREPGFTAPDESFGLSIV
jgi:hypothetical protein